MNLEMLDHFGNNYPQEFDGVLDSVSFGVSCMFNKYGTLLAVGCNDGRIVIWDFLTRGIAKIIMAHVHPVCSLSWTRNAQKLLSASTDNNVCVWNVLSGTCEEMYKFSSPVLKVQYHPRKNNLFLICPLKHAAVLVDTEVGHKIVPLADDDADLMIVASFDRRGQYIYTGNGRGRISVFTCPDLEFKVSFKISTGIAGIRNIEFARKTDSFVLNCSDRIIRVYDSKDVLERTENNAVEPIQKLQDLVNRTTWKKCCFSGDGEYVCAASARQHALYIWEKSVGNLVKILHGTKGELLLDVVWHPVRPIVASLSGGLISVWAQNQVENWSAFAPHFKELDENVEYEERESEFDIEDEDKSSADDFYDFDDDIEVDVVNVKPIAAYYSSDEEEHLNDVLMCLPVVPEPEDSEPDVVSLSTSATDSSKCHTVEIDLNNTVDELHPLLSILKDKQFVGNKNESVTASQPE